MPFGKDTAPSSFAFFKPWRRNESKRLIRLSIKQLEPTGLDEYMAEHKEGDVVSGRMMEVSNGYARVELGEGVLGTCRVISDAQAAQQAEPEPKTDLSALSSMLNARWKVSNAGGGGAKPDASRAGEIRSFRITKLDPETKKIELELAS